MSAAAALALVLAALAGRAAPSGYRGRRAPRAPRARRSSAARRRGLGRGARRIEWGPAPYTTRFRALWNDDGLYLRFDARDPSPWHTMTRRDEHLWEEEVVEIFLDPDRSGRDYYELEISPANVVCDVRMIDAVARTRRATSTGTSRGSRRACARRRTRPDGRPAGPRPRSCRGRGFARCLPRRASRLPPAPGRSLALQRVPHRAARRQGRPGEGRRPGRVVEAVAATASTTRRCSATSCSSARRASEP